MFLAELSFYDSLKELFDNNLINWMILIVGLYVIWQKYVVPILNVTSEKSVLLITDAKKASAEANLLIEEQKRKYAKLDDNINSIIDEAKILANELVLQNQQDTQVKINQIKENTANLVLDTKKNFISEVRLAVVESAYELASENLPNLLENNLAKQHQIDNFIQELQNFKKADDFAFNLEAQVR